MIRIFVWNRKIELYQGKIDQFILNNPHPNISFQMVPEEIELPQLLDYLLAQKADAILHRNEHGLLHCTKAWIQLIHQCLDRDIPVLSFDFGYFNHYKSFMVDFYTREGISSIYPQWSGIPTNLDWDSAPAYIQDHRAEIIQKVQEFQLQPAPLNLENIVTIWGQWTTELIKTYFWEGGKAITMDQWISRLIPIIKDRGYTPVVKMSPVRSLKWYESLQKELPVFVGLKKHQEELPYTHWEKNINYKLMAHSKYHIINCSSISNELLLSGSKVIAMGRSWFDSLGAFYEPKNWETVLDYEPPLPVNQNKWVNWWLDRQCEMSALPNKILHIYERAKQFRPH